MIEMENERRFLLNGFPLIDTMVRATDIKQGYIELPSSSDSFRARILGGKSSVLTLKVGKGVSRKENEEKVSMDMGLGILEKSHHRITKLRITCQGWEIDIFGGVLAGIILAEKEMKDPEEVLVIPSWLAPVIVREVTDSLTNLHLARLASDLEGTNSSALIHLEAQSEKIKKIVLTGGPCSGKSTIMELLKKEYPNFHFVPEVATIIIHQLGILPGSDVLSQNRFQRAIYRTQKLFEATSAQYATSHNMDALILDRGTWDGSVYLSGGAQAFESVVSTTQFEEYKCYDSIVFLSVPPKEIYDRKRDNNPARSETYDQAYELGQKIYNAWRYHPSFHQAMSDVWEEKVEAVKNSLK